MTWMTCMQHYFGLLDHVILHLMHCQSEDYSEIFGLLFSFEDFVIIVYIWPVQRPPSVSRYVCLH